MDTWIKIVIVFVVASLPMRCFGEYRQEQQRMARVEAHIEQHHSIPDCVQAGLRTYVQIDRDSILHYSCGR